MHHFGSEGAVDLITELQENQLAKFDTYNLIGPDIRTEKFTTRLTSFTSKVLASKRAEGFGNRQSSAVNIRVLMSCLDKDQSTLGPDHHHKQAEP